MSHPTCRSVLTRFEAAGLGLLTFAGGFAATLCFAAWGVELPV